MLKLMGQSLLIGSKIFSLAIITIIPPAIAEFTDREKYEFEYMFYFGISSGVCEMHDENALSYQNAKKYANQYYVNSDLKRSDLNAIHNSNLERYPRCPLPN